MTGEFLRVFRVIVNKFPENTGNWFSLQKQRGTAAPLSKVSGVSAQVSAQPLAAEATSLIEKETVVSYKDKKANIEGRNSIDFKLHDRQSAANQSF
jgi:hypothetical protein